ncbi:ankyrin repeat and socs box protein 2 [Plakobranchus ocellatus]|uniref:Ankyrin repeat and socs box protein 2 n=1 Tax=Plakobranchus ocellatus TaxID=259542 RepID=A0AAV4CHF7_9GAST|nr:ankyrin repeat and socs box protein 2 [Plakobranchus ocellatus]
MVWRRRGWMQEGDIGDSAMTSWSNASDGGSRRRCLANGEIFKDFFLHGLEFEFVISSLAVDHVVKNRLQANKVKYRRPADGRAVDDFAVTKRKKVKPPQPTNSRTYYKATVPVGNKTVTCAIRTPESLHDFIDIAESEENVNLFEFHINVHNYSYNPLHNTTGLFFEPWKWYTTRSRHGRTLLMLSFHYDVLSMNILTIGVKTIDVEIHDEPFGCFAQLNSSQQVQFVRMLLLSRSVGVSSSFGQSVREEFACNQEISNHSGQGEFVYNCCFKNQDGEVICSTKGDDFWINILYFAITLVKVKFSI